MSDRDLAPTDKVTAATLSGALSIVLAYVADVAGLDVPQAVSAAVTVLLMAGAAYLKREGNRVG